MPARNQRIASNLDGPTVVLFLLLAGLGWWNLVSASTGLDGAVEWSLSTLHGKQALWLVASLVLGALILQVDGEFFIRTAWLNYAIQIGLCAAVLVIGKKVGGARSWFGVGGFGIQPSEFAKITVILMMAALLSERRDREEEPSAQDVLLALVVAAIPTAIIPVQNDTGTVLILAAVSLSIVAVSGVPTRWLVGLIGAAILGVLASIQLGLLQEYQVDRLTSFINPDADVSASAYNANQARIAIGGGGLDGYGLFEGPQTQGNFVPVNESDFIFTVAGEELGFLGSALLIVLMAVILWRAVLIAWKADDLYGRLVATGLAAWLAFQMFENIGMTLGIMPITGIPLPFVSAGGTSMMATWLALGLLQTVRLHSLAVQRSEV